MKGNLHIEIKASVPKTETKYSCLFRIPFTNIHIGQGWPADGWQADHP